MAENTVADMLNLGAWFDKILDVVWFVLKTPVEMWVRAPWWVQAVVFTILILVCSAFVFITWLKRDDIISRF